MADTKEPVKDAKQAPETPAAAKAVKSKKKRKVVIKGQAHIQASYNNTIVSISDPQGNVLSWCSAGQVGFKGPKKSTPYAAGVIVKTAVEKAKLFGLKEVEVTVKGIGSGREAAVRALSANGLIISSIQDVTPIAHNGVRRPKPRRM